MDNSLFTDAEAWFEHADNIKQTDELFSFYRETLDQKHLTYDFFEEAGMMDIFFTLLDHLSAEKRFDDYLTLRNDFRSKQVAIYEEEFHYIDEKAIQYALYTGNEALAKDAFQRFMENPDQDIDVYLQLLQLIAFYGNGDWVEEICEKNYDEINSNEEYIEAPSLDLATHMFNHRLEVEYVKYKSTGVFDLDAWLQRIARFDMDKFDDKDKKAIYDSIVEPLDTAKLKKEFQADKSHTLRILGNRFAVYLYDEKQIPFIVSSTIWSLTFQYWFGDKRKGNLQMEFNPFDKHINSLVGFFNQYESKLFASSIGAFYVYDFLHKVDLINDFEYKNALSTLKKVSAYLENAGPSLWKNGFFKSWQKPDGMLEADYDALMKKTEESFSEITEFEYKNSQEQLDETGNEIDLLFSKLGNSNAGLGSRAPISLPPRTEPKIGRNDLCTCGSGKKYKKCCGA